MVVAVIAILGVWGPLKIRFGDDMMTPTLNWALLRLPFVVEVDYLSKGQTVFRGVQAALHERMGWVKEMVTLDRDFFPLPADDHPKWHFRYPLVI